MVKLSKDNKIKNQKIQNLQTIKTKQKKYSHYCKTISVRMESFSKFFFYPILPNRKSCKIYVIILYKVKYYSIVNESHVKSQAAWKNRQWQDHLHQTQNKSKKNLFTKKRKRKNKRTKEIEA